MKNLFKKNKNYNYLNISSLKLISNNYLNFSEKNTLILK